MKIYQFVPLAVVVIAAFCGLAHLIEVPVAPFVVIGVFGMLLAILQLEDHKWGDYLGDVIAGLKEGLKH